MQYAVSDDMGVMLLLRAMRSWPDATLRRGVELRAKVLDVVVEHTVGQARQMGIDLDEHGGKVMARTVFALAENAIELVLDDQWPRT